MGGGCPNRVQFSTRHQGEVARDPVPLGAPSCASLGATLLAQGSFGGTNAKKKSRDTSLPSQDAYPLETFQMTSQRRSPRFRGAGTHLPWKWLYQVQCQAKACAFLGKESHSLTGKATPSSPGVRQYVRFPPTLRSTLGQGPDSRILTAASQ